MDCRIPFLQTLQPVPESGNTSVLTYANECDKTSLVYELGPVLRGWSMRGRYEREAAKTEHSTCNRWEFKFVTRWIWC